MVIKITITDSVKLRNSVNNKSFGKTGNNDTTSLGFSIGKCLQNINSMQVTSPVD